jgi:serine/threonine-protein kinase
VIADKYALEERLGEGGMGQVWSARNRELGSRVALKILQPAYHLPGAVERLRLEARIQANFKEPGIARVLDFDETEHGDVFIVMELLEGQTLAALLEGRGPLPPLEAVRLLLPVASTLCAVHAKGIVHRDLKPANIILVPQGDGLRPTLIDFGIAKVMESDGELKITHGGVVLGSPAYMSPEQARGRDDVDQRSDVWAICSILYEAVSGHLPFEGGNYNAQLRAVIEDEVQPLANDEITAKLWAVLSLGLAKEPAERLPNVRALAMLLSRFLLSRGVTEDVSGADVARVWLRAKPVRSAAAVATPVVNVVVASPQRRPAGERSQAQPAASA